VIGLPPFTPSVHVTLAVLLADARAVTKSGADGALGIVAFTKVEAIPSPAVLIARIDTEYVEPFVRPLTTIGESVLAGDRVSHVTPPSREYL
jgi:hypothetical protein